MVDKIQILVCSHKPDPNTKNEGIYKAIQVGKALHPELDMGYLNDNTGDNISEKNPNWCELTALYWGWKNLNNTEYKGLCHYRRYFGINISENNIDSLMKGYDMITIKNTIIHKAKDELHKKIIQMTSREDFYLYLDTLLTLYPQYKEVIINYFYNSRLSIPYTMFIAKNEVYNDFCKFIFPVFFELEKHMKSHGYSRQQRAMGYFGETSLGLYITVNNLKYRSVPLEMCGKIITPPNSIKFKVWTWLERKIFDFISIVEGVPKDIELPDDMKVGFKQDHIEIHSLK